MRKLLSTFLIVALLCAMIPLGIVPVSAATERPTIKILSIGHSFSVDAMKTYMWDLFNAAGYDVTIGYLYYPGCSLERQYHYVKDNSNSYQIYAKNTDGTWEDRYNVCATDALWDEDWDVVTFQPSPDYGKGTMTYDCQWGCNKKVNDYEHFDELVSLVRSRLRSLDNPCGSNTKVRFYYHLTWAFASDCKLWSFIYSNYDQMTMYQDFIDATKNHVLTNDKIAGVIPCITSIQNARTTWMGDTFNEPGDYNPNKDGYHLNDKGDLVAAMTWVSYFTGIPAADICFNSGYSSHQCAAIAEAVDNAIATPWSVTNSTYGEGMEDHVYDDACDEDCNLCGEERTDAHVYDDPCDEICNLCGAERTNVHAYVDACDRDCNLCGAVRVAPHIYDGVCDDTCNLCDVRRQAPSHTYGNACDTTCDECGAVRSVPDHVYDNGCDVDCNECGYCRTPPHTYDNACDTVCNVCGEQRVVSHAYVDACDRDCNLCGAVRVAPHVYDGSCDDTCNACEVRRQPEPHTYAVTKTVAPTCGADGSCTYTCTMCGDTYVETLAATGDHRYDPTCAVDCTVCGAIREVVDHLYTDVCDRDCNACGFVRVPPHDYEGTHDNICDTCGAWREVALPGDLNDDGRVNNRDLGLFQQYLAGWDMELNLTVCDVNGDSRVNNRDLGLLQQYLAGWDVTLQ